MKSHNEAWISTRQPGPHNQVVDMVREILPRATTRQSRFRDCSGDRMSRQLRSPSPAWASHANSARLSQVCSKLPWLVCFRRGAFHACISPTTRVDRNVTNWLLGMVERKWKVSGPGCSQRESRNAIAIVSGHPAAKRTASLDAVASVTTRG